MEPKARPRLLLLVLRDTDALTRAAEPQLEQGRVGQHWGWAESERTFPLVAKTAFPGVQSWISLGCRLSPGVSGPRWERGVLHTVSVGRAGRVLVSGWD